MKLAQRFLALVCLVLLFVFCVSNGESMTVRFLSWESLELPAFLLLTFAFLAGAVLALLWQSLRSVTHPKEKKDKSEGEYSRKHQDVAPEGNVFKETSDTKPGPTESDATENEGEK